MKYQVEIVESAMEDLGALKKRDRVTIFESILRDLEQQTRNRKLLRKNVLSRWELRVGAFRVFYDVFEDTKKVLVTAVGYKERNRLLIRGKEVRM